MLDRWVDVQAQAHSASVSDTQYTPSFVFCNSCMAACGSLWPCNRPAPMEHCLPNKRGTNRTGNPSLGRCVGLAKVNDVRQLPEPQNSGHHEDTAACSHSQLRNPVCDTVCLQFNSPHLLCQASALQTCISHTGSDEPSRFLATGPLQHSMGRRDIC